MSTEPASIVRLPLRIIPHGSRVEQATFILITQNRMMAESDKRADLGLQVSLLAEHEVTRLITMVKQIGQRVGIEAAAEPELDELSKDVHPEEMLERIDEHERKVSS